MNLDSEEQQRAAFLAIMAHVKPGGVYYMIESAVEGLEKTNEQRQKLGLDPVAMPWHNLFFREAFVSSWQDRRFRLEEVSHFSSTYYFMSRVVYAKLAKDRNEKPRYDSDINVLSCDLPPLGEFGPARLWLWRKIS